MRMVERGGEVIARIILGQLNEAAAYSQACLSSAATTAAEPPRQPGVGKKFFDSVFVGRRLRQLSQGMQEA